MKIAKVYISILFALIFVFPSVYQAGHVVNEHWQIESTHHCCCNHEEVNENNTSFNIPKKEDVKCAICKFEIAVFTNDLNSTLVGVSFFHFDLHYQKIQHFVFDRCIDVTKLRGPPYQSIV